MATLEVESTLTDRYQTTVPESYDAGREISDDKKRARINCMMHFLWSLPYPDKDTHIVHQPDPLILGYGSHVVHASDHILGKSLHPEARRR